MRMGQVLLHPCAGGVGIGVGGPARTASTGAVLASFLATSASNNLHGSLSHGAVQSILGAGSSVHMSGPGLITTANSLARVGGLVRARERQHRTANQFMTGLGFMVVYVSMIHGMLA